MIFSGGVWLDALLAFVCICRCIERLSWRAFRKFRRAYLYMVFHAYVRRSVYFIAMHAVLDRMHILRECFGFDKLIKFNGIGLKEWKHHKQRDTDRRGRGTGRLREREREWNFAWIQSHPKCNKVISESVQWRWNLVEFLKYGEKSFVYLLFSTAPPVYLKLSLIGPYVLLRLMFGLELGVCVCLI